MTTTIRCQKIEVSFRMSDNEEALCDLTDDREKSHSTGKEEISNADLLSLMKTYMKTELSGIKRNLDDTTKTLEHKVKK